MEIFNAILDFISYHEQVQEDLIIFLKNKGFSAQDIVDALQLDPECTKQNY